MSNQDSCFVFLIFNRVTIVNQLSAHTSQELLRQVAEGDEQAFTQLFHQWQSFLYNHIYRITELRELSEEIVQDVFFKIWQTRETLSEIQHFKAYLLVVSKNHAINALQKLAREYASRENWVKDYNAEEETADPDHLYYSLIDEAVDHLSERQKQVYLLHRHQRMTYQQIAEYLGIGKESVKTHIELAIKQITRYIKGRIAHVLIFLLLQG